MENNPESPAAAAGSWGESVMQTLQMGEESEVSAVDPLLLGGVSDDAPEPSSAEALASQGEESARGGQEQVTNPIGDQPAPVQIARAATPASPGHSELSRMEGGGVAAKWDPDEDELVPDYASMPVVPEGSGSYPQGSQGMEDTQRVGRCTTHSAAMDVDEPGGEVTPLLGQLMDRLEAMEAAICRESASEVKVTVIARATGSSEQNARAPSEGDLRGAMVLTRGEDFSAVLQQLGINDGDKDVSPLLAGDWLTLA
ncbi:unnamed protein product, partial [Symbiodinium sp. KB8]